MRNFKSCGPALALVVATMGTGPVRTGLSNLYSSFPVSDV